MIAPVGFAVKIISQYVYALVHIQPSMLYFIPFTYSPIHVQHQITYSWVYLAFLNIWIFFSCLVFFLQLLHFPTDRFIFLLIPVSPLIKGKKKKKKKNCTVQQLGNNLTPPFPYASKINRLFPFPERYWSLDMINLATWNAPWLAIVRGNS